MIVHTVREPFLCREGQFSEGKRDLCIGLDYHAIKSTKSFWCYLGKNKKTIYEIDSTEALRVGQTWKNPAGKTVIIVPLTVAKVITPNWSQEEYDKKEKKRAEINQERLFPDTKKNPVRV